MSQPNVTSGNNAPFYSHRYLGQALEQYRGPGGVESLLQSLGELEFTQLTPEQYQSVEAGDSMPYPLDKFIGGVATHYNLGVALVEDLKFRARFDIIGAELGNDFAYHAFGTAPGPLSPDQPAFPVAHNY